ncbi:MAG: MBOAT family protein [Clostridia bacterium]|nr:MBOAT family protein [Clostridia bacterium]
MYFSSLLFLFIFLPAVLAVYYILPKRFRNAFLLLANLVFYGWGEPVFIIVMLISVAVNYVCALLIEKKPQRKKPYLIISLVISLGLLAVFKYTGFVSDILRAFPPFAWMPHISIPLPIGISFYTFQTLSYTIDVYRGDTKAQKSIVSLGTYISFFPQLIAGPIVRYRDIAEQLDGRKENLMQFADGVKIFIVGLAKKVLIANQTGVLWEALKGGNNGILASWVGIIAFAFQIYFDFSGYSDMAVGLGKMFGFEFMRNFEYPYISKSITEFWRRWHISLSTWFRDYVYIPLGGNRCSLPRVIFNLFAVWFLTGLWHGASANFIAWGLYYFVLLVLEKYVYGKYLDKLPSVLKHIYAIALILIGWTIFSFDDWGQLVNYIGTLFSLSGGIITRDALSNVISYLPLLIAAAVASLPLTKNIYNRVKKQKWVMAAEIIFCAAVLLLCTASLVNQSYNPFLYFRF